MSAKATAATSTSRSAPRTVRPSCRCRRRVRDVGDVPQLHRRPDRHHARADLFYAPNINSYKRFVDGSFAPTAIAWGMDNRTCSLRVVGHGHGMRMECRAPGGDVNPYLAVAALIAGGLRHRERSRARGSMRAGTPIPVRRNDFRPHWPRPRRCSGSAVARAAFGDDVVEHYLNNARWN
jgi:glutamine synthetase